MDYADIELRPLKNHRWMVLKEIKYGDIIVPKGYITNGADIPRIFWSYIPPNLSDIMPAVIIHDYLCSIAKDKDDYKYADNKLDEVLRLIEAPSNVIWSIMVAVRFYTRVIR